MHEATQHLSTKDRPLRVTFIVGTLGRGGAERQLIYMLRVLKDTVDTRVLCLTKDEPLQAEVEELDIPVQWVGADPSRKSRAKTIIEAIRLEPADLIQSTHFFTNLYTVAAARALRAKSIGAVRSNLLRELKGNRASGCAALLLPDYLVVNSQPARDRAVRFGRTPGRVAMIRNAVDVEKLRQDVQKETPRQGPAEQTALRLLLVGRLIPEKRGDRFLRLVRTCTDAFPEKTVEARIVGEGPERASLESLRQELGLDAGTVRFTGEVADPSPHYSWADILMLTSDQEGTPNVLLEAMAAGLPVVATAAGGVPNLLCRGGGLMVAPTHEDRLFDAVRRLDRDPGLQRDLVDAGTRYVERNHSLESLAAELHTLYHTIMDGRGTVGTRS